jgi:hypothetical protein
MGREAITVTKTRPNKIGSLPLICCSEGVSDMPSSMEQSTQAEDAQRADAFNDFSYWHLPPPSPEALGLHPSCADADVADYSDLAYWRVPVLAPETLGVACPSSPSDEACEREEPMEVSDDWHIVRTADARDDDDDGGGGDDDDDDGGYGSDERADPAEAFSGLMAGDAGDRLLGLLGRLSQHLGAGSRFARATEQLQTDFRRARLESAQGVDATQLPEGSTLAQPEVMSSVGSLLTLLRSNNTSEPASMDLDPPEATPPMLLFDIAEAAMPPPSPASPESIAALSPPRVPAFALDQKPGNWFVAHNHSCSSLQSPIFFSSCLPATRRLLALAHAHTSTVH